MCVSALENIGVSLVGHCIARCLVGRRIPPKVVLGLDKELSSSTRARYEGRGNIFGSLHCVTRSLSQSLTIDNLLLYCSFEAAFHWSDTKHKVPRPHTLKILNLQYNIIIYLLCEWIYLWCISQNLRVALRSVMDRPLRH